MLLFVDVLQEGDTELAVYRGNVGEGDIRD